MTHPSHENFQPKPGPGIWEHAIRPGKIWSKHSTYALQNWKYPNASENENSKRQTALQLTETWHKRVFPPVKCHHINLRIHTRQMNLTAFVYDWVPFYLQNLAYVIMDSSSMNHLTKCAKNNLYRSQCRFMRILYWQARLWLVGCIWIPRYWNWPT